MYASRQHKKTSYRTRCNTRWYQTFLDINQHTPNVTQYIQMISAHWGIKVSYSSIAANTLGKTTMVHIEPINLIDCMEQYRVIDMTKLYCVNRTDKGLGVSMKTIMVCWMLISWVRLLVSTRNGVVLSWHWVVGGWIDEKSERTGKRDDAYDGCIVLYML